MLVIRSDCGDAFGKGEFPCAQKLQMLLSGSLTFGVPLILALRELAVLRRGGGGWRSQPAPEGLPKPLPPCLLALPPKPHKPIGETSKSRVLEPV